MSASRIALPPMSARRRAVLAAGAAALAWGALCGAMPRAARAAPGLTEALDLDPVDAVRDRPVPMRLHLPASDGPGRVPMVVFSHGIGGSRAGYRWLGAHWAAQGFASLHLQHVGSDRSLWGAGSPFGLASRLQAAARESEAIARAHDLRFALDHVLGGPLGVRIDARHVVAAGHSYGANTTLLAAGARVERDGRELDLHDPRVKAAIVISAPPFYGEPSVARVLAPVRVPSLHVTATDDVIRIPGYWSGAEDRIAVFDAIGGSRKLLAVFAGGSHSMFTDRAASGGAELNLRVKAATRELTTAFLRSVLLDDDAGLRDWPRRHAALVARFVGDGAAG